MRQAGIATHRSFTRQNSASTSGAKPLGEGSSLANRLTAPAGPPVGVVDDDDDEIMIVEELSSPKKKPLVVQGPTADINSKDYRIFRLEPSKL